MMNNPFKCVIRYEKSAVSFSFLFFLGCPYIILMKLLDIYHLDF